MLDLETIFDSHQGTQRQLMLYFHELLTEEFGMIAKVRFKLPFYYQKSWICYSNPRKDGSYELAFMRGNELTHSLDVLDVRKRTQVHGLSFQDVADVDMQILLPVLHEAIVLDEMVPYSVKKLK